ncbi:MAG: hypothetical protein D6724_10695 [Armatimonadetes bacterium]|nr:MAG: hypothetical protein D6724_10695 [Armatimonadota bacterium]
MTRPAVKKRRIERERRRRRAVLGRQCRFCLAFDSETTFATSVVCQACARAHARYGTCEKCGQILRGRKKANATLCAGCGPDRERYIRIILLEDGPLERERVIWRAPCRGGLTVSIKNRRFKIAGADPLVVALPTSEWLTTRR